MLAHNQLSGHPQSWTGLPLSKTNKLKARDSLGSVKICQQMSPSSSPRLRPPQPAPCLKPLTPLAAHEHGAGSMSCSVVTFPTPQEIVPEYSCALGKSNSLSDSPLDTGLQDLTPGSTQPLLSRNTLRFPCMGGQGSACPGREEFPREQLPSRWRDVWKPTCC